MRSNNQGDSSAEFTLPGLLITFEGGEGAGKTTLINSLEEELRQRGLGVIKTREPGGSKLGEQIRNWLLNAEAKAAVGQRAELLLFLAARAQHLEELIVPALKSGVIVLCDRFNDSSIAYQGIARGLGEEYVRQMCELVCEGLSPDLTFYVDIKPQEGLQRTRDAVKENAEAGQMDRIESEKLDFHENVRKAFLHIAREEPDRFHTLNGSLSKEEVFQEALRVIEERLLKG